jgi:hypothetical protein
MKILFVKERETKGAVRYQEVTESGDSPNGSHRIGTLYFRKTAFITDGKLQVPDKIEVLVTTLD